MKIKIEIKHRMFGSVLFAFETENNTIAKTVVEAIRCSADLRSADLSYADLRSADLSSAGLRSADLRSADLRYADLSYADLRSADLSSAGLSSADLRYADLSSAGLRYADLRSADLRYADLRSADLRYADLSSAGLSYADLRSADLRYADLRYADLRSADLSYADLKEAKEAGLAIARTRILPDEGDIIGWKKCYNIDGTAIVIVKLLIPGTAKRSHAFGRKCRASEATVLEIIGATEARSQHDETFVYHVGDVVKPKHAFDEDWTQECRSGIHFYITKIEAENN